MRLTIFAAVAINTLALVECKLVSVESVLASMSMGAMASSVNIIPVMPMSVEMQVLEMPLEGKMPFEEAQVIAPVPIVALEPVYSGVPVIEPPPALEAPVIEPPQAIDAPVIEPPQALDAPIIKPTPSNDSDPIVEVPIVEPVTDPTEDSVDSLTQPLSNEEIEHDAVRAAANSIGPCKPDNSLRCYAFLKTDGTVCSNSSSGVACNTRGGTPCTNTAFDACFNFAKSSGVFCSNGGCAQFV